MEKYVECSAREWPEKERETWKYAAGNISCLFSHTWKCLRIWIREQTKRREEERNCERESKMILKRCETERDYGTSILTHVVKKDEWEEWRRGGILWNDGIMSCSFLGRGKISSKGLYESTGFSSTNSRMTESEGGEYSTNFRSILTEILDYSEWKTIDEGRKTSYEERKDLREHC